MKNSEEHAAIFMEVTAEIEGKSRAERIDILYGLYGKPLEEFPGMTQELKEMCNKMDPMERIRLQSDIAHSVERSVGMVATLRMQMKYESGGVEPSDQEIRDIVDGYLWYFLREIRTDVESIKEQRYNRHNQGKYGNDQIGDQEFSVQRTIFPFLSGMSLGLSLAALGLSLAKLFLFKG